VFFQLAAALRARNPSKANIKIVGIIIEIPKSWIDRTPNPLFEMKRCKMTAQTAIGIMAVIEEIAETLSPQVEILTHCPLPHFAHRSAALQLQDNRHAAANSW
jgi:hypothetical protein